MSKDTEKLAEVVKDLERLISDLGWLHWPSGSSTESSVKDKVRRILEKAKGTGSASSLPVWLDVSILKP